MLKITEISHYHIYIECDTKHQTGAIYERRFSVVPDQNTNSIILYYALNPKIYFKSKWDDVLINGKPSQTLDFTVVNLHDAKVGSLIGFDENAILLKQVNDALIYAVGSSGTLLDKVNIVKGSLDNIVAALKSKGLEVGDNALLFNIASYINMLEALPTYVEPEWQPHPDWWDIKKIFEDCTEPDKRVIHLLMDNSVSIGVWRNNWNSSSNVKVITSDGAEYINAANIQHTWTGVNDKPCSLGYKTRYIIVCSSLPNINISMQSNGQVLYSYYGNNTEVMQSSSANQGYYLAQNLQAVEYDNSVTWTNPTVITYNQFHGCYSLRKFNIPSNYTILTNNFFNDCRLMTKYEIPNGFNDINHSAFNSNRSLKSIIIPPSVTRISFEAFRYCMSLERIDIPNNVTIMEFSSAANGGFQFQGCYKLRHVTIGTGLSVIPRNCFENTWLERVVIPSNITEIQLQAFSGLGGSLVSVTFNEGLITIGNNAFDYAYRLEEIKFPNSLVSIGSQAFRANSIKKIDFGSGLTTFVNNSFESCGMVHTIKIQPGWICPAATFGFTNQWTVTSIEEFITNLGAAPTMRNINVNAVNLGKITSTMLALAQSKNYNFIA